MRSSKSNWARSHHLINNDNRAFHEAVKRLTWSSSYAFIEETGTPVLYMVTEITGLE